MRVRLGLDPLSGVEVDAVVRTCTPHLVRPGEDDLLAAAGPAAVEACQLLRRTLPGERLAVGQAVTTTAGDLPARWIVHLVPPAYDLRAANEHVLRRAYRSVLAAADAVGARTLALTPIGTVSPYWPVEMAVAAAIGVLPNTMSDVREVRLHLRTPAALEPFAEALARR